MFRDIDKTIIHHRFQRFINQFYPDLELNNLIKNQLSEIIQGFQRNKFREFENRDTRKILARLLENKNEIIVILCQPFPAYFWA